VGRSRQGGSRAAREERIVHAIEQWTIEHNAPPRPTDWQKAHGWPSTSFVYNVFGSWTAALEAAGLESWDVEGEVLRERVANALKQWTQLHGEPPRRQDWNERRDGWPSAHDVRRAFGTMTAASRAAGLSPRTRGSTGYQAARREEIVEAILRWTALYGRPPRSTDWDPHRARTAGELGTAERFYAEGWPRADRVKRLFGSWRSAIDIALARQPTNDDRDRD
jgi:hypothetical protein